MSGGCFFFLIYCIWSGFAKSMKESNGNRAGINIVFANSIHIIIYSILHVLDSIYICLFCSDGILLKRLLMLEITNLKFFLLTCQIDLEMNFLVSWWIAQKVVFFPQRKCTYLPPSWSTTAYIEFLLALMKFQMKQLYSLEIHIHWN